MTARELVTVDEAAGDAWLTNAPQGVPVDVVGHNSVVVALAGLLDIFSAPNVMLQRPSGETSERSYVPAWPRDAAVGVAPGAPIIGTHSETVARLAGDSSSAVAREMDTWRGALAWSIDAMRASAAEDPRAGLVFAPLLIVGAVVVVVGIAAAAVVHYVENRLHENAETARLVQRIHAAAADRMRDVQVWRDTGTMPPPSPLQLSVMPIAESKAADWFDRAEATGVKVAAIAAAAWVVKEVFFSRSNSHGG